MEVTLSQMLAAREHRAAVQEELLKAYGLPLICFTMNIPGPEKDSPLIRRGFQEGCQMLETTLKQAGIKTVYAHKTMEPTGCEGYYAVCGQGEQVKRLCVRVEDSLALGRLFDMDVHMPDGRQLRRESVGGRERGCMVCGDSGRGCASRRIHTVPQLQEASRRILTEHFWNRDREQISSLALRGLLDEVCVTPKPGLVDRVNRGSHEDMDLFTFTASAAALAPYLSRCVSLGRDTAHLAPEETFCALREAGIQAEERMYAATGGINTHKGAIFTLGTVCGAIGRLWRPDAPCRELTTILKACARMSEKAVESDLTAIRRGGAGRTVGQKLYLRYGLTGIRGEVSAGLPSVERIGLPALQRALRAGKSRNDGAAIALLYLIAAVVDTNMIARGGLEEAEAAMKRVKQMLAERPLPEMEQISQLDQLFMEKHLSPGGCADLLAVTLFLHDWCSESQNVQ